MSGIAVSSAPQQSGRFVDLHSHSTASDGVIAPLDVIREARRVGLVAIALTDHDTTAGIPEAETAAIAAGIRFVRGIELSAVEQELETHILGLHLHDIEPLERRLTEIRAMRRARAEQIVRQLNEAGVRITFQAVLDQSAGAAIGRPHVARALVAEGWATDQRDAFDRYLGAGRPAYVAKEKLPVPEAIELIHRAGGLAVMAHPAQSGTRARVQALVEQGLDGLEVRHPSHSGEDVARLGALVDHFRLIPSGGSDWHGSSEGGRALGTMRVPEEWLARQDERVLNRRQVDEG